jgi:hypothetical protein
MARSVKNPSGYVSKGRGALEKARNFAEHCKDHGWTGKISEDEPHVVHLFARRGEVETIDIWWHANGSLMLDRLPIYTVAAERIKLKNVSAAAVRVSNDPDAARMAKAVRRQRRQLEGPNGMEPDGNIDEYITAVCGSLPFDHESTDDEIKTVLLGRAITWVNRQSGQLDSAVISSNPKQFKVVRNGHDYVDFVQAAATGFSQYGDGFKAVYLDSIVSVS